MSSGVYRIRNTVNGRLLVGGAKNIERRIKKHFQALSKNQHKLKALQRDFNNHGVHAFEFDILVRTDQIKERTQRVLDAIDWPLAYNICKSATFGDTLTHHPDRERIMASRSVTASETNRKKGVKGRKKAYGRPGEQNGMFGKTHTPEVRQRLSQSLRGNSRAKGAIRSKAYCARMSEIGALRVGEKNGMFGKHHTEETKQKLREARKGQLPSNVKPIRVGDTQYVSSRAAATALGINSSVVTYRLKSKNFPEYQYVG